jgi:hypothetical protein
MPAIVRAAAPAPAGDGRATQEHRSWYLPDQAKLQLAGNVGFVSPSVGWSWRDRRLEADLFFGWVPQAVGGIDIYSLTGKLTWLPWRIATGDEWQLIPLSLALQLTYTFGDDYFVILPDHYPEDYYELPTALRAGVGLGGGIGRPLWGVQHVGVYYELVAIDALLGFWVGNPDTVGLTDVFSLALGLRVEL